MDFNLNDDQLSIQAMARDFARKQIAPFASTWDENKIFPRELLSQAAELGFLGVYINEDIGGSALKRLDACVIFEELAAACPSTTAYITIHNMVTWMIDTYANESVRKTLGSDMTAGTKLGSYCLTEPSSGSDAGSLQTRAVPNGEGWILNGSKSFISGAGVSDVLVVMARTGSDNTTRDISAFAIDASSKGISFGENERKLGWNSQPTRSIAFDNVYIPRERLLGEEGMGFKIAMKGLDGGRINIATCSLGAAQSAIDHATRYMHEREQFGKPLAQFQALQFKVADMVTHLVAARSLTRMAAFKLDSGDKDASTYCAMAKRFATDKGFEICNDAVQIFGGYGYSREYPVERLMRDSRAHQILEGTNEIMRVIIARDALSPNGSLRLR
ncbi:MAG: acyl-CoA dehydrogenase family protein [Chitinophagaceae bacterium]|nr:acyl-CoA dehydrogenase family protein [Oligoflexus sp.]